MSGRREQADVGCRNECIEPRAIGWLCQIKIDDAFVDVERAPFRPRPIGARRIDLDHVGAEIGEHSSAEPAEAVRRVDHQHIRQEHGSNSFTPESRLPEP